MAHAPVRKHAVKHVTHHRKKAVAHKAHAAKKHVAKHHHHVAKKAHGAKAAMGRPVGRRGIKLSPVRPQGLKTFREYLTTALPAPPPSCSYASKVADYPMAGNDQVGDCTIAAVVHANQVWAAELGQVWTPPSDQEVEDVYFGLTGGQDTGLGLDQVLKAWHREGLFGTKIAAYAPIDIGDATTAAQAMAFYGVVYTGVDLPANAEQQFSDAHPWTCEPGRHPGLDGHCVLEGGYDGLGKHDHTEDITWGDVEPATWNWGHAYVMERWAVIPQVFVDAGHGPTSAVDLQALQSDLANLNN